MDELQQNQKYHISYLLNTKFEQAMMDYYIGLGTQTRPPYLDELFSEAIQSRALLILEQAKSDPYGICLEQNEWSSMHQAVWENNDYAKFQVLEMQSEDEMEVLVRDVFSYVHRNSLSLLQRENSLNTIKSASLFYSPIERVW